MNRDCGLRPDQNAGSCRRPGSGARLGGSADDPRGGLHRARPVHGRAPRGGVGRAPRAQRFHEHPNGAGAAPHVCVVVGGGPARARRLRRPLVGPQRLAVHPCSSPDNAHRRAGYKGPAPLPSGSRSLPPAPADSNVAPGARASVRFLGSVEVGFQPNSGRVGEGMEGDWTSCAPAVILPAIPLFVYCPEDGPR